MFEILWYNPINTVLIAFLVYLILLNRSGPLPAAPKHQPVIVFKTYTPKELFQYNGKNNSKIYLAVCGKVFDVSRKPDFYGPGGMYENFAGRDASRGLAKNSFLPETLTDIEKPIDKLEDLSLEEKRSLEDWFQFFEGKYSVVGELINE
jgi:membrane-associated progesterone receptor component